MSAKAGEDVTATEGEGGAHRIADIRAWRAHTAGLYGLPHYPSDPPMVTNNKGWWRDVDALLNALDEAQRGTAERPLMAERRTLTAGDRIAAYPCVVTIDTVKPADAYGRCETCDDRHIIDRIRYERCDGPWQPVEATDG